MKAQKVYQKLGTLFLYELDTSLNSAIKKLQEIKDQHPGKDIRLNLINSQHDDGKEYCVVWVRPENEEEEIKKRQEQDAEMKEYRRKQYENLKKEFE